MSRSSPWSRGSRVGSSVAAGLALVGVALIWTGWGTASAPNAVTVVAPHAHGTPPQGTPQELADPSEPGPAPTPEDEADVRDSVSGPVLSESDPLAVSIPRLGVQSPLVELGLDVDRAMEVPRDPARAGWFSRGATPGALGPAVIAGHVTWDGAPGVFYRLGTLQRGDRVEVTRDDGRTAVFAVERVARFSKSRFPTRAVYGAIDHAGLRLITCGGTYDKSEHRYLDNIVVFARLDAVRSA